MLTVMTWLWEQPGSRFKFTAAHVNGWAAAIRDNTTIPVRVACVTDMPEGIDSSIDIIPLPQDFVSVQSNHWSEEKGLPQCYRRLAMFRSDAADLFGERFCSMDLDLLITGSLDPIFSRDEDFIILKSVQAPRRPYSGGIIMMDAGARPQVYDDFTEDGARHASSIYTGSDQAWICHKLGPGEAVFDAPHIGRYNKKFVREYKASKRIPSDLAILFFAGWPKSFMGVDGVHGGSAEDAKIINELKNPPPRLLVLQDQRDHWTAPMVDLGAQVVTSAKQVRKHDKVFIHMSHSREWRQQTKQFAADMHDRGIETLPAEIDCRLYDDKLAQLDALKKWMPQTVVFTDHKKAKRYLETCDYPIISKSSEGAGSANVRKHDTKDSALFELEQVFADGLPVQYGWSQSGYVYYQRAINHDGTYRVTVTGDYVWGYFRANDSTGWLPKNPSSGPGLSASNPQHAELMRLAIAIADEIGTRWCAFDFVIEDYKTLLLEMSCSWPCRGATVPAVMYNRQLEPTDMTGKDMFRVARDILMGDDTNCMVSVPYKLLRRSTRGQKGDIVMIEKPYIKRLRELGVIGDHPAE